MSAKTVPYNFVFVSRCSHVGCTSLEFILVDRIMDGGQGQLLKKWYPSERVISGVAGLSKGSHNAGGGIEEEEEVGSELQTPVPGRWITDV